VQQGPLRHPTRARTDDRLFKRLPCLVKPPQVDSVGRPLSRFVPAKQ